MDKETTLFLLLLILITFVATKLYRYWWSCFNDTQITPTGFGQLLSVALLASALKFHSPYVLIIIFIVIFIATEIYWLDDICGLTAGFRMGICFLIGIIICAFFSTGLENKYAFWLLVAAIIGTGCLNMIITNIVNFYDGADLNLAALIFLHAVMILLYSPTHDILVPSAIACIGFIIPFAYVNRCPRTLYFGDGGCFTFASFLTLIMVLFFNGVNVAPEIGVPLALPALDTLYVLYIRIKQKHDLLTRNYLHLYQKLSRQYGKFEYLVPQFVNVTLVLACSTILERLAVEPNTAVFLAIVLVTPSFYFWCRRFLLHVHDSDSE